MSLGQYLVACCLAVLGIAATAGAAVGDRGSDVNVTFPTSLLLQNGGPIIDVKQPPEKWMHAAVGDGVADDTAAFQDAYDLLKQKYTELGPWTSKTNLYVYMPNGAYLISDTIIYRGEVARWKDTNWDICHVKFVGQSRAGTVLRLADHANGFQDAKHPRPVLAYQHPDTGFNNVPASNVLRNVTIDVGKGNLGAVGVMFQGANQTDLRNVTIRSADDAGTYGLWFRIGSIQGYYTDVTIEGFDYGIWDPVNPEGDPAFEYLTLRRQKIAGIHHSGGGLSLRCVLSDQSAYGAMALQIAGSGPQAVLIDSLLTGGKATGPAIELTNDKEQCLFARNVSVKGYSAAVRRAGITAVAGDSIDEYVSLPATTLFPDTKARSLGLPIQDTPQVSWYDPGTQWAIVDDFASVQAAMNSGKPVVCFKKREYDLGGVVTVPASVKFINLLGTSLKNGELVIGEAATEPLLLQDGDVSVRIDAQRDVIARCFGRGISNPKGLPVTFYLENVNDCATGDDFCRPGQKVFARQIDIEYRNVPQIVANGGTMWIFGFKTEDNGTAAPFVVKNNGFLEVLGGYVNEINLAPAEQQSPIITNIDSNASLTCFTNMNGLFLTGVREIRGGVTKNVMHTDFPTRGSVYRNDYMIPLYVGGKAP